MTETTIRKHTIKIQLIGLLSIIGFVIYWTFTASAYVFEVEDNGKRLDRVEQTLSQLVTKDDLQTLKEDLKDFIKK